MIPSAAKRQPNGYMSYKGYKGYMSCSSRVPGQKIRAGDEDCHGK